MPKDIFVQDIVLMQILLDYNSSIFDEKNVY